MFFIWLNVIVIVGLIVFKLYMNYRIERNMKRHFYMFYELLDVMKYTYLYDTRSYMGIGYTDFEGDFCNIFGKDMVG